MKKLFILFTVLFLASGCGENMENKTLSCTSTNNQSGITTTTKYDFKYKDDEIEHVTITYKHIRSNNDVDGVNSDTDGLSEDNNDNNNNNNDNARNSSNEVVDGVVGDVIDESVNTVTDTIIDIAGLKNNYESQMAGFDNIEGFSYDVDTDNENEYTIIYEIDMNKISDDDLRTFDIDRNLTTSTTNYEDLGYTCK